MRIIYIFFTSIIILSTISCDLFIKLNETEYYSDIDKNDKSVFKYGGSVNIPNPRRIEISMNGKYLYVNSIASDIFKINLNKDGALSKPEILDYSFFIEKCFLSKDCKFLYGLNAVSIYIYKLDINTGNVINVDTQMSYYNGGTIGYCDITEDGKYIYIPGDLAGLPDSLNIFEMDLNNGSAINNSVYYTSDFNPINTVKVSPDSRHVYVCGLGGGVFKFDRDINNGTISNGEQYYNANCANLTISPDGKFVFVIVGDQIISFIRNINTGSLMEKYAFNLGTFFQSFCVSNDSKYIYAGTGAGAPNDMFICLKINDNGFLKEDYRYDDITMDVNCYICVSPNDRSIYISSGDADKLYWFKRDF